jgi:hypothetical protein
MCLNNSTLRRMSNMKILSIQCCLVPLVLLVSDYYNEDEYGAMVK